MKLLRYIPIIVAMATAVVANAISIDNIPNVHVANRTKYVSDPSGYMSAPAVSKADSIIASMWNASSAEVVAVVVDNLDGKDIDSAATELFEKWAIGKSDKDNGVLMLVSVEDRKAAIRTGYGIEGVLPDITCGRILRNILFPAFKAGNYDSGVIDALSAMSAVVNDPQNADELMSQYENDATAKADDEDNLFVNYLKLGIFAFAVMLIVLIYLYYTTRGQERHERYERFSRINLIYLVATIAFLGIPVIAYGVLRLMMWRIRRSRQNCPNCHHKMRLIDEVHDNDYLTPAQDKEEQLKSVDYDVWHCDNCGENEILPYINHHAGYSVCPNCGARAERLESNTIVRQPTTTADGIGRHTYYCRNCNKHREDLYRIAKIVTPPVIIGGLGGRGGGGFGGGGFSGGGFGGGSTGGGGASGGW